MQPYSRTYRTIARIILRGVVLACVRSHERPAPVAMPAPACTVRRGRRARRH